MLDGSKEIPIFTRGYIFEGLEEPYTISEGSRSTRRKRYQDLLHYCFQVDIDYTNYYTNILTSIDSPEGVIIYSKRYLAIKTEAGIEILFLVTDKSTYISKNIKSYKNLWNKVRSYINTLIEGDEDITLTNNCGKNVFLQFEKPRFKSIQEREEYCNQLLHEVLPTKIPLIIEEVKVAIPTEDTLELDGDERPF